MARLSKSDPVMFRDFLALMNTVQEPVRYAAYAQVLDKAGYPHLAGQIHFRYQQVTRAA
jgi:hypothetical protein